MAKQLTQKNVRRNGNLAQGSMTFVVAAGDTIAGTDFQVPANDGTGDTLIFTPRFIDFLINAESSAVAVDGRNYASGTWNFYQTGGIPVSGPSITVGAGNITVQFRS